MKKINFVIAILATSIASAQVGIGTTDPKATLDVNKVSYTTGEQAGIAVTQQTAAQIEGMSTTGLKAGTLVYATTATGTTVNAVGYWNWTGTTWLKAGGSEWTTVTDPLLLSNKKNTLTLDGDLALNRNVNGGFDFFTPNSSNQIAHSFWGRRDNVSGGWSQLNNIGVNNSSYVGLNRFATTGALPFVFTNPTSNTEVGGVLFDYTFLNGTVSGLKRVAMITAGTGNVSTATNAIPGKLDFRLTDNSSLNGWNMSPMMTLNGENQNIGVNNIAPNSSSILDLTSTTKGFLPPRMTSTQMYNIPNPIEGLIVYCTNCLSVKGLRLFDGTNWVNMNGQTVPASFTISSITVNGDYHIGKVMDATNTLTVLLNVTSPGLISFSTPLVDGYRINMITEITNTGSQEVTIAFSGTKGSYSASGDAFTLTGVGISTQTLSFEVTNVRIGSQFTTFINGSEMFSANTACASKVISISTSCPSSVTVGSNTYNTVAINGQCWLQTNIKEASTVPCADVINAGCNVWLNTSRTVTQGGWGYYNTSTTSGLAGWRTT